MNLTSSIITMIEWKVPSIYLQYLMIKMIISIYLYNKENISFINQLHGPNEKFIFDK